MNHKQNKFRNSQAYKITNAIKLHETSICLPSSYHLKEKQIKNAGFKTKHIDIDRKSINPIKEFLCILKLLTIIFKFKPNIIQANALKPILYISLISFSTLDI